MHALLTLAPIVGLAFAQNEASFTASAFGQGSINAASGSFWIGRNTVSTCPSDAGVDCTMFPGRDTVFAQQNNALVLDVGIPSDQQVYVDANGALKYTAPNSAVPSGAVTAGFARNAKQELTLANSKFYACQAAIPTLYQIYARKSTQAGDGQCTEITVETAGHRPLEAWQYL
jgi:hypothetical protein